MQRVERSLATGVGDHVIKCAHLFRLGGTTFVVLAVGFGSGLMMASSMLRDPTGRAPSAAAGLAPVRVILPTSAEPAHHSLVPDALCNTRRLRSQ